MNAGSKASAHLACVSTDKEELLQEAAALCELRGGKWTPLRQRVLSFILESERPLKAYDLLARLKREGSAKPPTVYRSLEFLIEIGLIHRIESSQAYIPCGHWKHEHTAVLLICAVCGTVYELCAEDVAIRFRDESRAVSFEPRSAIIEAKGTCEKCR